MTQSNTASNTASSGKTRRLSLIRLFNGKTKNGSAVEPIESSDSSAPAVPSVPVHYRHSMAPSMAFQSQMMRERRKSIAALTDATGRSVSLELKHPAEMTDKMRQFDELLQKRRGSTIRISLTPSLLQE
ncbi:hypothetical protein BGX26_002846 [Mortierella sp. AD094]|nr:hypothetical protein BGX26_002846 [Mortierella sp. AD094]